MIAREVNLSTKKGNPSSTTEDGNEKNKASSSSISNSTTTTTSWTRLKDPRIVRVSRAFGGKDRHSKVCTIRGLRDRRVRLSVSTAIQLYDLQDRLGLNQPSKVVDWLLNAAKDEIDELPPLQIPPGSSLNPNFYPMLGVGVSQINNNKESLKSKEVVTQEEKICNLENHGGHYDDDHHHNNNNIIEPKSPSDYHSYNMPGALNINALPYNSNFLKWDPSNLSLAHHGVNSMSSQHEDMHNFNVLASMPLGSQVVVYPQGLPQSFFHPHNINVGASSSEFDPKEINFQMLSSSSGNHLSSTNSFRHDSNFDSSSQSVRPYHFLPSQNNEGREPNKDREFH